MERIAKGYSELIGAAFDVIPDKIGDRIRYVRFLTGVDPIYAGLFDDELTDDGRSYRNTACVAYPYHQRIDKSLRHTTVVLPSLIPLAYVVHELGHVLDESLGFSHIAEPVTEYAKVDRMEAFAEAFTSWLFWGYGKEVDKSTEYLFECIDKR